MICLYWTAVIQPKTDTAFLRFSAGRRFALYSLIGLLRRISRSLRRHNGLQGKRHTQTVIVVLVLLVPVNDSQLAGLVRIAGQLVQRVECGLAFANLDFQSITLRALKICRAAFDGQHVKRGAVAEFKLHNKFFRSYHWNLNDSIF